MHIFSLLVFAPKYEIVNLMNPILQQLKLVHTASKAVASVVVRRLRRSIYCRVANL